MEKTTKEEIVETIEEIINEVKVEENLAHVEKSDLEHLQPQNDVKQLNTSGDFILKDVPKMVEQIISGAKEVGEIFSKVEKSKLQNLQPQNEIKELPKLEEFTLKDFPEIADAIKEILNEVKQVEESLEQVEQPDAQSSNTSVTYVAQNYEIIMVKSSSSDEIDDIKSVGIRDTAFSENDSTTKCFSEQISLASGKKVTVIIPRASVMKFESQHKQENKTSLEDLLSRHIETSNNNIPRENRLESVYNEIIRSRHGSFAPRGTITSIEFLDGNRSSMNKSSKSMSPNVIAIGTKDIKVKTDRHMDQWLWEENEGYPIYKHIKPVLFSSQPLLLPEDPSSKNGPQEQNLANLDLNEENVKKTNVCCEFLPPIPFANLLVENVISKAKGNHQKLISHYGDPKRWSLVESELRHTFQSRWPSIKDFSRELGISAIEEYILKTNVFIEDWKYTLFFYNEECDMVSDHYFYVVKFSLPNEVYPVAQVSASLLFHIEVSRTIPPQCPIKITFEIEGCRQKINPDKYILRDYPLLSILKMKIKQCSVITF